MVKFNSVQVTIKTNLLAELVCASVFRCLCHRFRCMPHRFPFCVPPFSFLYATVFRFVCHRFRGVVPPFPLCCATVFLLHVQPFSFRDNRLGKPPQGVCGVRCVPSCLSHGSHQPQQRWAKVYPPTLPYSGTAQNYDKQLIMCATTGGWGGGVLIAMHGRTVVVVL